MALFLHRRFVTVCFLGSIIFIVLGLYSKLIYQSEESNYHPHSSMPETDSFNDAADAMNAANRRSSLSSWSSKKNESFRFRPAFGAKTYLHDYLKPVNTLYDVVDSGKEPLQNKKALEYLIRTGQGLDPYTTERGEPAWIENGIVYRPWRRPDPSTEDKKNPNPYFTEYEAYMPYNETWFFEGEKPNPDYKTKKKIILWHTPTRYTAPKNGLEPMKLCPEFPCQITTNRQYMGKSAAAIFTAQIIKGRPPPRSNFDQIYILHNHEPPFQGPAWNKDFTLPAWTHAFNWTMTYRMDSDFVVPYGIVRKRPVEVFKDYTAILAKKKKVAAWLVSNCQTSGNRAKYVKELQKYIDVDVYGKCGTLTCPHAEDGKCAGLITGTYKFYLSFESSFCPDYISEKFFHYLTMDTLLVARGSNEYFQHAPSEIFLNTADYSSPKELAEKMKFLDQNDDAYIAMLREKDKYMSLVEGFPVRKPDGYIRFMAYRFESVSLCRVCQHLWNLDKYRKTLPDSQEWFRKKKQCYKPTDLNF